MFQLSEASQAYLLKLSRQTLDEFLSFGRRPTDLPTSEELLEKRGAFVTLASHGRLRGCIGYVVPLFPLYKTVIDCSISAATEDPRFEPLKLEELEEIECYNNYLTSFNYSVLNDDKLTLLDIRSNNLSEQDLTVFSRFINLEKLDLLVFNYFYNKYPSSFITK